MALTTMSSESPRSTRQTRNVFRASPVPPRGHSADRRRLRARRGFPTPRHVPPNPHPPEASSRAGARFSETHRRGPSSIGVEASAPTACRSVERAATSRRTPSCTLRQDFISNASATRHHWLRRRAISRPRPSVWRAHCCQPVRYSSVAWRALDTATNQSVHSLVVSWGTATSSSPWFKQSSPFSSRLAKKDYRDRIGVRDVCTMELITILNRRE
jgi:hypothetical protein